MSADPDPQVSTTPTEPSPTTTPTTAESTPEPKPEPTPEPTPPASLLGDPTPESTFGSDAVTAEAVQELIPEGFEPDAEALTGFIEMINGAESRSAIIGGSLELLAAQQVSAEEAMVTEWNSTQDAWRAEVTADKTLGGENEAASLAKALTVVTTYGGTPEQVSAVKEMFKLTGAGNHLAMVRLLNNIADAVPGEAVPVQGDLTSVAKSRADKLFGANAT